MSDLLVICTVTPPMRAQIEACFRPVYIPELTEAQAWLRDNGEDVAYLLTDGHLGVPQSLLELAPNLKAVSSYGVGYDAIDTAVTNARKVPVSHTPSVLDEEVATTALLLYISAMRGFVNQANHAQSGGWETQGSLPLTRTADGRDIGILGLGRIGKAIARKLAPFEANISYCGRTQQDVPYRYFDDLSEMAAAVDALICVAPGGAATKHLVNAAVLEALGPTGILVNVGRGSVVDEAALIEALQSGKLGAAALDVFENEPHIPEALRTKPNVVVTPHIGSATEETRQAMGKLAVDNLIEHKIRGKMLTPVPECTHLFAD